MYKKEIALLRAVKEKKAELVAENFMEFFISLENFYAGNLRHMKNHLFNFNGLLYRIFHDQRNQECLFRLRLNYNENIELTEDISELKETFYNMLTAYMNFAFEDEEKTANSTVNEAIRYMKKHLNENLTLGDVAAKVHISKSYLSSLLAKYTGESFPELLTKMRMNYAGYLLKHTNISILDVSYKCGYNSQSYFCSTFKRKVGQTPSDYRECL